MVRRLLLVVTAAFALAGCNDRDSHSTGSPPSGASIPANSTMNSIPLGAPPGQPVSLASDIRNPFEGDAQAVQDGKRLFGAMNCVYCHAGGATGLMGPALNAPGWRYGGTPADIYNSIHDGRPKGMPAWGDRLPPNDIWRLVAYIESLGGASPPATPEMARLGGDQPPPGPQPAGQEQTQHTPKDIPPSDRKSPR